MASESSLKMNDDDFKQCFDVLQRHGEKARSTVYTFVLVYGALLLWALNAIVYPAEQQRLGQSIRKQVEVLKCLIILETKEGSQQTGEESPQTKEFKELKEKTCPEILHDTSLYYRIKHSIVAEYPGAKLFDFPKIDSTYQEHVTQYQLDKSSEVARFNVPIIGIASDRTWLWLINITLGPLFYYIIRDSFTSLSYLLRNLYRSSTDRPIRLMLLSTAQIVSSSTQKITWQENPVGNKRPSSLGKLMVMSLIFMLPIYVSGLLLYDWYYFASRPGDIACNIGHSNIIVRGLCVFGIKDHYSEFFEEPEFFGGLLTIPILLWEIALFLQIRKLLVGLSGLHRKIRNSATGGGGTASGLGRVRVPSKNT